MIQLGSHLGSKEVVNGDRIRQRRQLDHPGPDHPQGGLHRPQTNSSLDKSWLELLSQSNR